MTQKIIKNAGAYWSDHFDVVVKETKIYLLHIVFHQLP